jgi:hypothetical protein
MESVSFLRLQASACCCGEGMILQELARSYSVGMETISNEIGRDHQAASMACLRVRGTTPLG